MQPDRLLVLALLQRIISGTLIYAKGNTEVGVFRGAVSMTKIKLSRAVLLTALAACLFVVFPTTASAAHIGIGFYGGYGWGPWGYPYYPYGFVPYGYAPYGYGPYGYPYGGRPLGEVHIKAPDGNAQIFINGAFAGRAHDLKRFYLVPGTYNIEQRAGSDVQKQRVYVIANRSLNLVFDKPGTAPALPPPPNPAPNPGPNNAPPNVPPPAPNSQATPQQLPPAGPDDNGAPAPAPEVQR
jgi:hypothetical protein